MKCSVAKCGAESYKDNLCVDHYRNKGKEKGPSDEKKDGGLWGPKIKRAEMKAGGKARDDEKMFPANMPRWERLQIKIFSRWITQKVQSAGLSCRNCLTDISPAVLISLMETLSDTKCPYKLKPEKMLQIKVDNYKQALDYTFSLGNMKNIVLKPGVEDFLDAKKASVLGFVWNIMMNFLKFDSDDESLSALDALMMWLKNQTKGYKGVNVTNFNKCWHDGLALCALIHKFRPKLIPFDTLTKDDPQKNLQLAMDAAEQYFGLDQFLDPSDIPLLEDKSMMIYLSEFYYGIYNQRKVDLAAKRVTKLIKMTQTNDKMKNEYDVKADVLKKRLEKVGKVLDDRTVDNTMEGAIKKLDEFYAYRANDKPKVIGDFLSVEALYNHLAMRLAEHHRPPYLPEGLSMSDMRQAFITLETREAERNRALFTERNRQLKLNALNNQHKEETKKLSDWVIQKKEWLAIPVTPTISDVAEMELLRIRAFKQELDNVRELRLGKHCGQIIKEMESEHYEKIDEVKTRYEECDSEFGKLREIALEVENVREDDFKRLEFIEGLRLRIQQHSSMATALQKWCGEKTTQLQEIEATVLPQVDSIHTYVQTIDRILSDQKDKLGQAQALSDLGNEIKGMKYEGRTTASCENAEEMGELEQAVKADLDSIAEIGIKLKPKLADEVERREFMRKLELNIQEHGSTFEVLAESLREWKGYLTTIEDINSVPEARMAITTLGQSKDEINHLALQSNQLKQSGESLKKTERVTEYSAAKCEKSEDIDERHKELDKILAELNELITGKRSKLDEQLQRELKKADLKSRYQMLVEEGVRVGAMQVEICQATQFGFEIEEVEAFEVILFDKNEVIRQEITSYDDKFTSLDGERTAMELKEDFFENRNEPWIKAKDDIETAISARNEAYKAELALQMKNDMLCHEFADLANPFIENLTKNKDSISAAGELEKQMEFVESMIESKEAGADLPKIEAAQKKIDDEGITNNRWTLHTYKDVFVQYEQYIEFFKHKKAQLHEEIEHKMRRGVTDEQLREIKTQFSRFDGNKNNFIEKAELRNLFFSLGEDRSKNEIADIMKKYGASKIGMAFEQFQNFMIDILGDTDTKDEILAGFRLMMKGDPNTVNVPISILSDLFTDEALDYLKENAPTDGGEEDKLNFVEWTESVFAR